MNYIKIFIKIMPIIKLYNIKKKFLNNIRHLFLKKFKYINNLK